MYFFLPCAMRFLARFIAKTLSTMSVIASPFSLHNSFNRFINHTVWHAHNEAAIYSTSQEESVSTNYFFEYQEIGVCLNIKIYPVLDFLSSLSLHQLATIYLSKLHFPPFPVAGFFLQPIKSLTYLRILLTATK